jgi:small ligand-binding sensory domain FIST
MGATIAVGVSEEVDPVEAFGGAAAAAADGLGGEPCDLCLVFASAQHLARAKWIMSSVYDALDPAHLLGCGAGGVVGAGREIEEGPGAVVWAASLPGAEIAMHHVEVVQTPEVETADNGRELRGLESERLGEALIVLADPYTFAVELLLKRLNSERPGMPVLGGLASAAAAGSASLMVDGDVLDSGAAACSISGVPIVPCVSQGATPVGPEMTITGATGNVISELASKQAIARLREAIGELEPDHQALAAQGLMLGIVIDENQPDYDRGDFLVRPIIGSDPAAGSVAVGEQVRVGQTVRMHVRDGASADEDLREALRAQALALGSAGAAGALLFTCNGRGSHMFDLPDHDAAAVEDALGVPAAGFFCAGEIGPVGGRNFLHGFTATLAVFAGD